MTDHKYGERVLVEADFGGYNQLSDPFVYVLAAGVRTVEINPRTRTIHPHPGVPVADLIAERDALLEEVELLTEYFKAAFLPGDTTWDPRKGQRINQLRNTREARKIPLISGPECGSCGETIPVPSIGTRVCGCGMTSMSVYGQCEK